jgi:hypothetical protein
MSQSMLFLEQLMIKPTAMQGIKDGITLKFAGPALKEAVPSINRAEFLSHLVLPVEYPLKMSSKMPSSKHEEKDVPANNQDEEDMQEKKKEKAEDMQEEKQEEEEKKNHAFLKRIQEEIKGHTSSFLIYQKPGSSWICADVVLALGYLKVLVDTAVPDDVWFQELQKHDPDKVNQQVNSDIAEEPGFAFRRLATVDQDAIKQQVANDDARFERLDLSNIPNPLPPVIVLENVEDFCHKVAVIKDPPSMRLYQALVESVDTRIVALTQFPCYQSPAALKTLETLLSRERLQEKTTIPPRRKTRRKKGSVRNKTHTLQPSRSHSIIKVLYDDSESMPKQLPLQVEKCEMSKFQIQQYHGDEIEKESSCNFALEKRPFPPGEKQGDDIVQRTLYEREVERIVEAQDVSVAALEKHCPKYLRLLEKLKQDGGGNHLVYTRHDDLEGKLLCAMLKHHGLDFVTLPAAEQEEVPDSKIYIFLGTTGILPRLKEVDFVHVMEPPAESLVQMDRIVAVACHAGSRSKTVTPVVYVSTVSQKVLTLYGEKKWEKSVLTKAMATPSSADKGGQRLQLYCETYLGGDMPSVVTLEESVLENMLVKDYENNRLIQAFAHSKRPLRGQSEVILV